MDVAAEKIVDFGSVCIFVSLQNSISYLLSVCLSDSELWPL